MASTVFNIAPLSLPNGITPISERSMPAGLSGFKIVLDVSSMVAGQLLQVQLEYWDTISWHGVGPVTCTGPFTDKNGIVQNNFIMGRDFGALPSADGQSWVPILSDATWTYRATIVVTNGPIASNGGSITLS